MTKLATLVTTLQEHADALARLELLPSLAANLADAADYLDRINHRYTMFGSYGAIKEFGERECLLQLLDAISGE